MSEILCADAAVGLKTLPPKSVQMCVTSPPYYGLRDYGANGQIGVEQSPEEYIARLTEVFAEVHRVLKDDGTLWLNIADSYAGSGKGPMTLAVEANGKNKDLYDMKSRIYEVPKKWKGVKPKDMIGIPWMLAFALREFGYYLRSDIIWHKTNCLPESVKDRPSKCYEHIFLLSKSPKYYFDYKAIQEPIKDVTAERYKRGRSGKAKYAEAGKGQGIEGAAVQTQKGCMGGEHEHFSDGRAFCNVSRKAHRAVYPCRQQSGRYGAGSVFRQRYDGSRRKAAGTGIYRHRNQPRILQKGRAAHRKDGNGVKA